MNHVRPIRTAPKLGDSPSQAIIIFQLYRIKVEQLLEHVRNHPARQFQRFEQNPAQFEQDSLGEPEPLFNKLLRGRALLHIIVQHPACKYACIQCSQ